MCREPILGRQITLHAFKMHSVLGEMGVAEEARVERDVEEQRDRTSESDSERGIGQVEDKKEREKECRERAREDL